MPLTVEEIKKLRDKFYNATVAEIRKLNPELAIVRIKPDFAIPPHQPGQYSTLGLGYWEPRVPGSQDEELSPSDEDKMVRRAYSISHPVLDDRGELFSENRDWAEFYVVLVKSATGKPPALTPRLFMLAKDDRIFLGEKFTGHYTLEGVRSDDTVLLLSTGTGEAPHNFMLWHLLRQGHRGEIVSACCVRYRRDLGYLPTHEQVMKRFPNYHYLPLTTREADTIHQKVYIQDVLTSGQLEQQFGIALDPKSTHVFLCGNPNMIGIPTKDKDTGETVYPKPIGVIELLEKRGFKCDAGKQRGNIHFEKYW